MDAIFMNSENSKAYETYRLLLNLTHKINLRRSDKFVALPNLKNKKTYKNNKRKI